jgi:hypothetical protein
VIDTSTTHQKVDIDALRNLGMRPAIKFELIGLLSYAGEMGKITTTIPFREIAERFTFDRLLTRHDFDIDDRATTGNRDIAEGHVKKITAGIRSTDRPYLGTLTVALGENSCEVEKLQQLSDQVWIVRLVVREDAPNPVIEDGQHRIKSATALWPLVKEADEGYDAQVREWLERTSVEMTILLEDNPSTLSTIFVRMGSTKAISQDLIAVMDRDSVQNRLGQFVAQHSQLLSDRVSYMSASASKRIAEKKGRAFENLYPAAAVRSAASSMAGVGVRDRSPEQREGLISKIVLERARSAGVSEDAAIEMLGKDLIAIFDYAYGRIPGWKEIKAGRLSVANFKKAFVHSSAAGLHVICNVVAAARAQGIDARLAVDGLATLPWEKSALRKARGDNGEEISVHEFFEGTLAKTAFDPKSGEWRAGTGGATRSTYEPAIDKAMRHLANNIDGLNPLGELSAAVAIGLPRGRSGPGRPRKTA